jgi:hypothetical protein
VKRPTRLFSIVTSLLGSALFLGCSEAPTAPLQPQLAIARPKPGAPVELTPCNQPYAVTSGVIGPHGGMLKAGGHRLWVPAGALKKSVLITMEIPAGSINRVVVRPEGLAFSKSNPLHLVMSYTDCEIDPGASQQIGRYNEAAGTVEVTPSDTDPVSQTVDGSLYYLSDYVLLSTYAVVY